MHARIRVVQEATPDKPQQHFNLAFDKHSKKPPFPSLLCEFVGLLPCLVLTPRFISYRALPVPRSSLLKGENKICSAGRTTSIFSDLAHRSVLDLLMLGILAANVERPCTRSCVLSVPTCHFRWLVPPPPPNPSQQHNQSVAQVSFIYNSYIRRPRLERNALYADA